MNRREWWGIGAAVVCYAVSLVVISAGGPFVVGAAMRVLAMVVAWQDRSDVCACVMP